MINLTKHLDFRFRQGYSGQAGQAMMVATMFFLAVSITIIFGMVGPIVREQKIVSKLLISSQSYFLAEAGLEDVVYRLGTGKTVGSTEVLSLGGNTATTITTDTAEGKEVVATGDVLRSIRKVKADVVLGTGATFHYGVQIGTGGFVLNNNAGIEGNVYSNSSITGSNGSFVTGDAFAVGNITNVDVGGQKKTGVEPQAFPIAESDIANWKDEAALGGTFVGNKTLSGITNVLGPLKIQGNLTLDIGAKLTMTGTIWVTGNLTLSNNSTIALSSGYGTGDGLLVIDGNSDLSNGSTLSGSGTTGSNIMLLSTNTSGDAVSLSNNSSGGLMIYAPNGTVALSNNAEIRQVSAKTLSLANNVVLEYEQGVINVNFTSGPGGGYDIDSWKEVE